jgi:hypothetical protein
MFNHHNLQYNTRGKAKLNRSMDTHVQMMLGSFLNFR